MIKIGDLVKGHWFHRKIGVVTKLDDIAEMAYVQYSDRTNSWESLSHLKKAVK